MKKIYEEPMIVVEQYALTQNVAACSQPVGATDNECIKTDPDATDEMRDLAWAGFFYDEKSCKALYPYNMSEEDSICYHTNISVNLGS